MGSNEVISDSEPTVYHHVNLPDADDAIRLIQVLPDLSADGLVQCTLHDATISDSKYVCLSYTWGPPGGELPIQLNGKPFYVRRNLWDFLHVARRRLTYCMLWIDAIVIDQANVRERNHQVQHMGSIFQSAEMVVTWLGDDPGAEELLRAIDTEYDKQTWNASERFYHDKPGRGVHNASRYVFAETTSVPRIEADNKHNEDVQTYPAMEAIRQPSSLAPRSYSRPLNKDLCARVGNNNYWKRAWVTQEILLAKAIVVVARDAAVDFTSLACRYSYVTRGGLVTPLGEYGDLVLMENELCPKDSLLHGALLNGRQVGDWDLLLVLKHFQGKCCALRRDRIYSLLSLCRNGDQIKVDYNASDNEVIVQVLDACHEELCFCSAATVARIVGGPNLPLLEEEAYLFPIKRVFQLQGITIDSKTCALCSTPLPTSWQNFSGVYFCLKGSSAVCTESHGHFFWDCSPKEHNEQPTFDCNCFYYQANGVGAYYTRSRPLARRGRGIEIARAEASDIYTLYFTLGALVDMIHEGTYLKIISSHVCRTDPWH